METYKTAIEAGVMTVNEARAREGLPPLDENMQPQEDTNDEA